MGWPYVLLIFVGVTIVPFALGNFLSRALKMPDHGWKFGVILCALAAGTAITATGRLKYGIDLRGGVIMVYEYVVPRDDTEFTVDGLVQALSRRVNPGGVKEVSIRPYGQDQIEIIIPEADSDEVELMKEIISKAGTLEFRIVANANDHAAIIREAEASKDNELYSGTGENKTLKAQWVPVDKDVVEKTNNGDRTFLSDVDAGARRKVGDEVQVLTIADRQDVTGEYLRTVRPSKDEHGRNSVNFRFNSQGATRFGRLTSDNIPDPVTGFKRALGIVLDGYLYSAPVINGPIYDNGVIEGDFSDEEINILISVLKAGSLPATLVSPPASSMEVGPGLGHDLIIKGAYAMAVSMAAVLLFMLVYYRFAGLVACIALLMNLLLIMSVMIALKAAFTLPGLAGLVLTVGMAVDANVLIFERMREESNRGSALRMAIRNGFGRATTTIVDANVTTLITAIILYVIGTDQVKGFAVILILGIVMSMFTAIFCSRVLFDVAERRRWIRDLKMMGFVGATNFDFLSKRRLAAAASVALIVVGMAGVVVRGRNLLNIDFTGGYAVTVLFDDKHPHEIGGVRAAIAPYDEQLPDATISSAQQSDEAPGIRYLLNTTNDDGESVQKTLIEIFDKSDEGPTLARVAMSFDRDEISEITAEDADGDAADKATTSKEPAAVDPSAPVPMDPDADETAPSDDADTPPPASPEPEEQSRAHDNDELLLALASDRSVPVALVLNQNEEPPADEPTAEEPDEKDTPATAPIAEESGQDGRGQEGLPPVEDGTSPESPFNVGGPGASNEVTFVGGSEARLHFTKNLTAETVRRRIKSIIDENSESRGTLFELINPNAGPAGPDDSGRSDEWVLRIDLPRAATAKLLESVQEEFANAPIFPSAVKIGGRVASNTRNAAVAAIVASLFAIIGYLWIRFQKVVYGLAAVVALIHDVLVTLGALALSLWLSRVLGFLLIDPFKIDLNTVAAFLTIVGYSLNDTIVVFDRIREVKGKSPQLNANMINTSINQTLSRTLLTSLTTLLVVLILYIGGGQGIHGFAFALLVGVVVGTYSSIFIASPVLYWLAGQAPMVETSAAGVSKDAAEVARA